MRQPAFNLKTGVASVQEISTAFSTMFPSPEVRVLAPEQMIDIMVRVNPRRFSHEVNRIRGWAFDAEEIGVTVQ